MDQELHMETPIIAVNTTPEMIEVPMTQEADANTTTSDLASQASSRQLKTGESLMISDWVQKGLFKYCKFITSTASMAYGEPLSLFALEENNVLTDKQKWWNTHKKEIIKM